MSVDHFFRDDGTAVWALDVHYVAGPMRRLMTLSNDAFLIALYAPHQDMDSAIAALHAGSPPSDVIGGKATQIPLGTIRRVDCISRNYTSTIHYMVGSRQKKLDLLTPGCDLYADVFAAIHKRLGGILPITTQPASAEQTLNITPWTGLGVMLLVFMALAAIFPEEAVDNMPGGRGAAAASVILFAGSRLGRGIGIALAVAIIGGILWAIAYRLAHRPHQQSFEVKG